MRISLITNDPYLARYLKLKLEEKCDLITRFDQFADIVLYDCDSDLEMPQTSARLVTLSRRNIDGAVSIPLPSGFFDELLSKRDERPSLLLSDDGRYAFLKGNEIKLTSHEYALLSLLISGGENYTSRSEISKTVWKSASDSLVNVYIHYLREKLESGGEKIIVSSRKYGYKINSAYLTASSNVINALGKENQDD